MDRCGQIGLMLVAVASISWITVEFIGRAYASREAQQGRYALVLTDGGLRAVGGPDALPTYQAASARNVVCGQVVGFGFFTMGVRCLRN